MNLDGIKNIEVLTTKSSIHLFGGSESFVFYKHPFMKFERTDDTLYIKEERKNQKKFKGNDNRSVNFSNRVTVNSSIQVRDSSYVEINENVETFNMVVPNYINYNYFVSSVNGDILMQNFNCGKIDASTRTGNIQALQIYPTVCNLSSTTGKIFALIEGAVEDYCMFVNGNFQIQVKESDVSNRLNFERRELYMKTKSKEQSVLNFVKRQPR